ncbi:hypothetical protein PVK06_001848 [Gossypium arboreum]|uniref:Uncharacterized protein n=1 Tax=Gossypium arboreum TaxID=29729 RepID=A0ABR0R3F6_GOSAR|nr:hypothetical protein PVK06_001848 [Gossypium arboreum]
MKMKKRKKESERKEIESEERRQNVNDECVIDKKESEIKKESSGNERSVFTNQKVSCSQFVSSFQVSKEPVNEFQLHYSTSERRFQLIEKGKLSNKTIPQVLKGKQGKELFEIKSRWYSLNVDDKYANDIFLKRSLYHDPFYPYFPNVVDKFVLNNVFKRIPHDMFYVSSSNLKLQVDKSIDVVELNRCSQNLIGMGNQEFPNDV